jgi:hypothetical protein
VPYVLCLCVLPPRSCARAGAAVAARKVRTLPEALVPERCICVIMVVRVYISMIVVGVVLVVLVLLVVV